MDAGSALLLAGAGLAAGFINTLAGGGSLLTLPALMLVGLPADIANGTNRVGIIMQSAVAALAFRRSEVLDDDGRDLWGFVWPTLLGAAFGALVATSVPRTVLRPMLLITMVVMAAIIAVKPRLMIPAPGEVPLTPSQAPRSRWALLLVGAYGGFLQAGIGFLLLAVIVGALRHPLARANAIKVVIVAALTVVALGIFASRGQVQWLPGLICGGGAVIGGLAGVKFATRASPAALRYVVLVAVSAASIKLALF